VVPRKEGTREDGVGSNERGISEVGADQALLKHIGTKECLKKTKQKQQTQQKNTDRRRNEGRSKKSGAGRFRSINEGGRW